MQHASQNTKLIIICFFSGKVIPLYILSDRDIDPINFQGLFHHDQAVSPQYLLGALSSSYSTGIATPKSSPRTIRGTPATTPWLRRQVIALGNPLESSRYLALDFDLIQQ